MQELVKRNDKIPFYGCCGENGTVYHRMVGFTAVAVNKNPARYTRRYIDEDFERSDIVGYNTSLEYSFDMFADDPVHLDIASIADHEKLASDAVRSIVIVDFSTPAENGYAAVCRDFSVIPSTEGAEIGAYTYSGSMKASGEKIFGMATSDDNWQTLVFSEI